MTQDGSVSLWQDREEKVELGRKGYKMRLANGVDLIEIERVQGSIERHGGRFLKRIYTPQELAQVGENTASLAARFAAKEAVAKALGQGLAGGPHAVVVESLDTDTGAVHVHLEGEMARRFPEENGNQIVAHTSRDGDLIVATSIRASSEHKETEHDHSTP